MSSLAMPIAVTAVSLATAILAGLIAEARPSRPGSKYLVWLSLAGVYGTSVGIAMSLLIYFCHLHGVAALLCAFPLGVVVFYVAMKIDG